MSHAPRIFPAILMAIALLAAAPAAEAANSKLELKCQKALISAATKVNTITAVSLRTCHLKELKGALTGPCPDQATQDKIDQTAITAAEKIAKSCGSTCSVSTDIPCITDLGCPPNGGSPEFCKGKLAQFPFDMKDMGFPGSFCPAILGGAPELRSSEDLGTCISTLAQTVGETMIDNIYGDLTSADSPSKDAQKCVSVLAVLTPKFSSKLAKLVGKCRIKRNGETPASFDPNTCATRDPKLAAKITLFSDKMRDLVAKKCTPAAISELDLCGAGIGATTTIADAQDCIADLLIDAVSPEAEGATGNYVPVNLIEATFPASAAPACGDNLVNQEPNQFALLGEECDGTSDDACPGQCAPAGDFWECTCLDRNRARRMADGPNADLDNGWGGNSHNSAVTDGAGYIVERTNCDCDQFDPLKPGNCIGSSSDPICDELAETAPRCSGDPRGSTPCDEKGDNNGVHEDSDCKVCDANSINAGDSCSGESDCNSQCFDNISNVATTPCSAQTDCAVGETCLGRCDQTRTCEFSLNGAPLPLSATGVPVCIQSKFYTNVTGTTNIVTGEHQNYYTLRSVTHTGESNTGPCPTCGGFCEDGSRAGQPCDGRCSVTTTDKCRFDDDCPLGETCTTSSPDCPSNLNGSGGDNCKLDLICSGGPNAGQACRIEAETAFGTTSIDCPPSSSKDVTNGLGLEIKFNPTTSEAVSFTTSLDPPTPVPCTDGTLTDCPCPETGGNAATSVSRCRPACNAGAEYGQGCGTGTLGAITGSFTKCAGGSNDGLICDEDADCVGGGTCSDNPTHCTAGNPAKALTICVNDSDCDTTPGSGDGVCGDACPSGECVALCLERGFCDGASVNAGVRCGLDSQCDGGSCIDINPEEGACAAGPPFYHCDGEGKEFLTCTQPDVGTMAGCEWGTDGNIGTPDDQAGAGFCVQDNFNCFVNDGAAEGGDTLNGNGDATNWKTVATYCIAHTNSATVNLVAGVPGPGRLRQSGVSVPNYTSLP